MSSSQPDPPLPVVQQPIKPEVQANQAEMDSSAERFQLKVEVKQGHNLPKVGNRKKERRYYVSVAVDGKRPQCTKRVASAVNQGPQWNARPLLFDDVSDSSVVQIKLIAVRCFHKNKVVFQNDDSVASTIARTENDRPLFLLDMNPNSAILDISVSKVFYSIHAMQNAIETAQEDVTTALIPSHSTPAITIAAAISSVDEATESVKSLIDTWKPLVENLKIFMDFVDTIAEIHPYVKIAWSVISATGKIVMAQADRDAKVISLLTVMNKVYKSVKDAKPLEEIAAHKATIIALIKQTIECAHFIATYLGEKPSFWIRAGINLMSDADTKIEKYSDSFKELEKALLKGASIYTAIVVTRMLTVMNNIDFDHRLDDMTYADGASFDSAKQCLPGTRESILTKITEWVYNSSENENVLLLTGQAGTGKSSIAHTIAKRFDDLKRLGSCFCFNRAYQKDRSPESLFSTVARNIADLDGNFKQLLYNQIEEKASRKTTDIDKQFTNFLLQPSSELCIVGPILIVIDALDECEYGRQFSLLLSILASQMKELPSNFRVLITSRPENHILHHFINVAHLAVDKSIDGVKQFIKHELQNNNDSFQFRDEQCAELAKFSQGLFQWAFVVCSTLKEERRGGQTLDNRYNDIISSIKKHKSGVLLDDLYTDILTRNFDTKNPNAMLNFRSVMGRILSVYEPLSSESLIKLHTSVAGSEFTDRIQSVINYMGSLLSGVHDLSVIKPLHSSFHDYLTNEARSNEFYVDISAQHYHLASLSLCVMNETLHYNIYHFLTSSSYNSQFEDIGQHIPDHLVYACEYWALHLSQTTFSIELSEKVNIFMHKNLLFWLEILSVKKQISAGANMLLLVPKWCSDTGHGPSIAKFAKDAGQFIRTFGYAISQSAPHIYISALPFTPKYSLLRQQYISQFPNTLQFVSGQALKWSALQNVIHTHAVTSVAFSPDGRLIASGSWDSTVGLWDSETGENVHEPFIGHTDRVTSVSFSTDGKYIASGSCDKTIRVWNVNTGKTVFGPFEGHTKHIESVAFASNEKWIVSGSYDNTIKLWNVHDGLVESCDGHGHTGSVYSVAFSPDCKSIASGSQDKTVRIWNVGNGKMIHESLKGHTGAVQSVHFSIDGSKLVSGSADKSVRVWDPITGTLIAGPFLGHTDWVLSVSFSPDGTKIASGSMDKTVTAWNTLTGEVVAGPFAGHSSIVRSVTFSPDGCRIASGSDDYTIRVWSAEIIETDLTPNNGHTGSINSITVSPDGMLIASGSDDCTIRIWNARTGDLVCGPFEGHNDSISSVAFSPDCIKLVSGSTDKTIRIWNVETGHQVGEPLHGHTHFVNSVRFSPDGAKIVSGSFDRTIRLWNAVTGIALIGPLKGHTNVVYSVAFSPDGSKVASSSHDQTVRIWNAITGDLISAPFKGHTDGVRFVTFSPDGLYIASGSWDNTIIIWDVTTAQPIAGPLNGHTYWIAYSSDGQWIASGSYDQTVRVWNAKTGEIVTGPFEHANWVSSVAFHHNGQKIVSVTLNRTIRIWDVDPNCHHLLSAEALTNIIEPSSEKALTNQFIFEKDGWVKTSNSELLFWIPPLHRNDFYSPRNSMVIGERPTKLNLDKFKHGKSWTKCRTSQSSIEEIE